jgi:phosphoesterase RecJ-like protein
LIIRDGNQQKAFDSIGKADLIICLDFHAFHRTGNLEMALAESKAKKILIDHHLDPDRSLYDLSFSKNDISSASELLFWILMATPQINGKAEKLPSAGATALMTGMTTDTNNFGNSVYPSTLSMTSALLQRGVDRDAVLDLLYNRHSENRLRLMGHMMKDLLTITDDGVAYIVLDRHTQMKYSVAEGDTEGFVNMPLSIGKVRMSILAKEDGGRIRISIRSKKGTSANRCAREHFNGGGHENAAGGRLFMPDNVSGTDQIGKYIEEHTHEFLTEKDEDNK